MRLVRFSIDETTSVYVNPQLVREVRSWDKSTCRICFDEHHAIMVQANVEQAANSIEQSG